MRAVLLCKIKKGGRGSGRSMKRVAFRRDGDDVGVDLFLKIFLGPKNKYIKQVSTAQV
jgi:hypothetical protein